MATRRKNNRRVAVAAARDAYTAKHRALRKGAKGTRAVDPMDLGLEAAYQLGARTVPTSSHVLLDMAAHERSYGAKRTAKRRAGGYLAAAHGMKPLNLPNPRAKPGEVAFRTKSGKVVRFAARTNPHAQTDSRSGTHTKITTKKVPGGYAYAVKNVYSPASRTVESFGSGRKVYGSSAKARAAALGEIAREGYQRL